MLPPETASFAIEGNASNSGLLYRFSSSGSGNRRIVFAGYEKRFARLNFAVRILRATARTRCADTSGH